MKKKILLLSMIMLILLIFTRCEKEEEITNGVEITDYQGMTIVEEVGMKNVFSSMKIELPNDCKFLIATNFYDRHFIINERIYVATTYIHDRSNTDKTTAVLHSYDFNGDNEEVTVIEPINTDAIIRFMWCDSQYDRIIIEELDYKYTLHKTTDKGELLFSVELDTVFSNDGIISMVIGENDNIYISTDNIVGVFSNNGELLWKVDLDYTVQHIISSHNKTPILKMYDSFSLVKYQYVDIATKSLIDIEMPTQANMFYKNSNIVYGDGYDYYHLNMNGVYGYDIESNTLTKVLDWLNSDIQFLQLNMFNIISPEVMAMVEYDQAAYKSNLFMLNKIPDDEIPQKKYISIGYISQYEDKYLTRVISTFNKDSTEYRITLTNYYSPYDDANSVLRLNNEIAAGNAPDIMYINSLIPILNHSKKNMYVDLNHYLKDEPELYNNLLSFVTEPAEINGKLTQMITKFTIQTLMGKTKNIGDGENWTFSDMLELYHSLSDDVEMLSEFSEYFISYYPLFGVISACVDYSNGTCDFNQQGFKDYLELIKYITDNQNNNNSSNDAITVTNQFYIDIYEKCRNDKILLSESRIDNIISYIDSQRFNFRDEEVTIIGYPTLNGEKRGDYIESNGFSILTTSENKDDAWEFIKYCLSDTFSERSTNLFAMIPTKTGLRIHHDWFEGQYIYYKDEGISSLYSAELINDIESQHGSGIQEQINDEWTKEFDSYLDSIDNYVYINSDIKSIIDEEISTYLNSSKSIDDTIKSIQSRVSIYMSEMWG